ncbi:uncharacterized protein LOC126894505 [Daktulosphaira vitifoliae]|uniref:uncharacterized protein LOC126894505 n=1 Tax=Daktulosphaira vitifoliae TaxID=58002 RepID=UPI0021AABA95|nr:uncharacterized protein LOC126894505 [Daktulosphaira vitifoliae]
MFVDGSKEESDDEESDDEESKEKKKKRPEDCCDSCDVNKGAIIPNKVDYEKKYGEGRTGNLCFKHKSCKQCAKKMLYRNKQCWICFNKYMGTYWGVEDDETKKDHEEEQAKNQDDVSTS